VKIEKSKAFTTKDTKERKGNAWADCQKRRNCKDQKQTFYHEGHEEAQRNAWGIAHR
jgi:hypothetical protein